MNCGLPTDFPNAVNKYKLPSEYPLSNLVDKCNTKKNMSSLT